MKEEYKKYSINHFSISLTKKYTAYSSIVLPPVAYPRFAVLVIKVKNHEDNSENGLCEVMRFLSESLNKDFSFNDKSLVKNINSFLDKYKNYFNIKKFTDDEIEKYICAIEQKVKHSHRKIIEDSKKEFQEIFRSSYLLNTPIEQILKDLDSK